MTHSNFGLTVLSIWYHWTLLIRASSMNPTCYFPNGDIAPNYQPCNSTVDADASICCDLSTSVCGTKGLCYGSNGYLYRGGCTDRSWKSAHCPTYCLQNARDGPAPLVPCTHGIVTGDFCCFSPARGNHGCCNRKFRLWQFGAANGAGMPFAPIGTQSTSLSAGSPTSSLPSTSTSASLACAVTPASSSPATISMSSIPQGSSSNLTAIGLGVGVPLGIILLLNLGFLVFRERRHRINTQQLIEEAIAAADEAHKAEREYLGLSRELGHIVKGVGELDSREVFEIHQKS